MSHVELTDGSRLVTKTRLTEMVKDAGPGKLQFLVSTADVDSDGDVIHQMPTEKGAGWITDHFNKSPLVLWSHDRFVPNLALPGTTARPTEAGLLLDPAVFDMDDPAAAFVEGKIRRGSLREFSVGVRYKTFEPIEGGAGLEVFEHELLEVSVVNRGANPSTAVLKKSMLRDRPELVERLQSAGDTEVEDLKITLAEYEQRIKELENQIAKIGDAVLAREKQADAIAEWDRAAIAVLTRMKKVGTAS